MTSEEAKTIDITPNQDGGVLKEVLKEGHADEVPMIGDTVFVHYTGTLLDGTKFDSSRDRGEQFSFELGRGSVIKGWDMGVPTMKKGELAKFTIRSEYAYGKPGSPPDIPPDATLVFEIELFEFHGEDLSENKDKSIIRRKIKSGTGYSSPNDGARVVVNLKGMDSTGRVFDQRENLEFEIGEGSNVNIIPGIEHALTKFKNEEHSRLFFKSDQAWGSKGFKEFGIGENSDIVYEVELKSFEKAKETWQLNGKEKLEQSELYKNKGTEFFKLGKYESALKKYNKIVEFLQNEVYDLDEEKSCAAKLQLAANLNVAACHLKLKNYRQAVEACQKSLELDANSEKGLFRMAQAYFGLSEFDEAIKYFSKVVEINPDNKEANHFAALSKQKVKEAHEKEKALYSKMISAISK
ncbi:peptidyl-prolyl cis-trans isomerase FKBP4 [Brachionus plicatilis]|uniref:peptidylprolyl isomerase n=1 Tax=Brachionus plicatilis TaxID=10195 RepID=A0A3M7SVD7_BRAPC|nr:peptidyl-prolyl cis-trans isomerase FKBP4 [Brachionus plicatilis]